MLRALSITSFIMTEAPNAPEASVSEDGSTGVIVWKAQRVGFLDIKGSKPAQVFYIVETRADGTQVVSYTIPSAPEGKKYQVAGKDVETGKPVILTDKFFDPIVVDEVDNVKPDEPNSTPDKPETDNSQKDPSDAGVNDSDAVKVHPNVSTIPAGQDIVFTAEGFTPASRVTFSVYSTEVVAGTVVANGEGKASITWRIPAEFELGKHRVVASNPEGQKAENSFTVTKYVAPGGEPAPAPAPAPAVKSAPAKKLAATGSESSILLGGALLALLGGGALFALKRRG